MGKWRAGREDSVLLRDMTQRLIEASTVRPAQRIAGVENTTGRSLLTSGYSPEDSAAPPAFRTRDPAWVAESGLIPPEDVWGWLTLMAETMHGPKRLRVAGGGIVLPYSVPDHIHMDGTPVYYPATCASVETQAPPGGKYPPHDDQYWPTLTAYAYAKMTDDWQAFGRTVRTPMGEAPLSEVCELTHNSFPVDRNTQTCIASDEMEEHIVDWGYADSVTKTGKLLFPSLLRLESALKLAELFERNGDDSRAAEYERQASAMLVSIPAVFYEENQRGDAWLISATGLGDKPDVWGSAFAVYRGFVDGPLAEAIARTLLRGFRETTTVAEGQVRHIPTSDGFWQTSSAPEGTGQNGAYWGYATGWYICALTLVDEAAAAEMFSEFMDHLRSTWSDDLKACAWECVNPELDHRGAPGCLTTIALPYACLKEKGLLDLPDD